MGKQLEGDMEDFSKGMTFEPRPELHEETSHERIGRMWREGTAALEATRESVHPHGEPWREGAQGEVRALPSGEAGEQSLRLGKGLHSL